MAAMDFQKATANRIISLFTDKEHPRSRVLLADEVGLGKTIVAKEVLSLMREWRKSVNDDFFRVVYICSNINIAKQNIVKLGIKEKLGVDESRLSMQHILIASKEKELKEQADLDEMPEQIIPLTPSTSFDFKSSCGIATERALIYELLKRRGEFAELKRRLSKFFKVSVRDDNWKKYYRDRYTDKVNRLGEEYVSTMNNALDQKASEVLEELKELLTNHESFSYDDQCRLISKLRMAFAEISVEMLHPDIVVMDEFQRFKSLLDESDNEQSMLTHAFFNQEDCKILLLSATPYKPYSTLEELNENGSDEHFSDFKTVVEFLNKEKEHNLEFNESWEKYNAALSHIETAEYDIVLAAKCNAEDALYKSMCRTERFNKGIVRTRIENVPLSEDDIKAYFQSRSLVDLVNTKSKERAFGSFPIEYVKSSPYPLSFMDKYKIKKYISTYLTPSVRKSGIRRLLIPYEKVNGYKQVPQTNAKFKQLCKMLFEENNADKLLWIPASRPYYKTTGVYSTAEGFSKVLVFSSWEMIPRMLSVMLSYEAEQRVLRTLINRGKRPGAYYKETKTHGRYGANRLSALKDDYNPLMYPCAYLSEQYKPNEHLGKDIKSIKSLIRASIEKWLKEWMKKTGLEFRNKNNSSHLCLIMKHMDGLECELPEYIPEDSADLLTDAAIAAPAVCFYRLFKDAEKARRASEIMIKIFNRAESATVLDLCYDKNSDNYMEEVLEYCVEGNLQAVIDEYDHMLEGDWEDIMESGTLDGGNLQVDMIDNESNVFKKGMRINFAIPFTNAKMDDKNLSHTSGIRLSFNSPFRPFVLSTTSVGQEGLDFHWYSRKLLHWNLPSNPVDMEQREGRVNRYKCLAIRQSLGKEYHNIHSWNEIFSHAQSTYKGEFSDMVPFWCLPEGFPEQSRFMVERIILQYPLSTDQGRYERLKKVLSLYRLTMGQPRQEELLEMLASTQLTEEQIDKLIINLCPFEKQNK